MEKKDKTSEAFAQEYERYCIKQYTQIDTYYPEFRKNVSTLLKMHTDDAKKTLSAIYANQSFSVLFKNAPEFIYLHEIINIYNQEVSASYTHTILDTTDTIENFISLIEDAKFLIWRIEFCNDPDSYELLIDYIKEYELSPYFIERIIRMSAFTVNVLHRLSDAFSQHDMISFEDHIHKILNDLKDEKKDESI